jgi:phosphonate transport system substrate-binding protein
MYSYSHNKSVELVAKKIADGAAVDSLVYEYMLKSNSPYTRQTKIIKRSPPYGMPPVVVTRYIHPDMKKRLKEILLSMHTTEKGKRILNAMLIDRFVEISDSAYDSIRRMEGVVWNTMDISKDKRDGSIVHFSVIPRDNPRILYEKYQPLLDYLAESTPYKYDLVLKKNYEDTVNALGRGELDIAFLDPLTYLEAHLRYNAATVLKPRGTDNSATYKSAIIKRKDSPIKTLYDLKGRSVAFSALKSASGNLMPRYLLASAGIHLNELSKYGNFDYHDSVVKAILRGEYDAGAVRDSVAKRFMDIGIEVIAESMPIPTDPLVAGPKTPASVTEAVKRALLELSPKNVKHQKILGKLYEEMRNGFIEASDSDYAEVRARFNAIPQTCGKACHPRIRL